MSAEEIDFEGIKTQARAGWGKGEYSWLSEQLRPAAEALVDACAVSAGQEVLDVAAGDGNFALAAAAEGAQVVASDLAPVMVERGRTRSEAEGFDVEWVEADAEDLPFEDGRFECVGSVFGAMIAPRPELVSRELFRVTRPGNTVGMVAWAPGGRAVELFSIARRWFPAPEGVPKLEEWGRDEVVRERFEALAHAIEFERRSLPWEADSPEEFVSLMEVHAPMHAAAKERMPAEDYARLREETVEVVRGWAGGDGPFSVDVEYLITVARRRG